MSNRLDLVLEAAVTDGSLPCVAAAAWSRDGLRYEGAFGEQTAGIPMRADSIVWIASLTKAVTSVGAMALVEQGIIDLDQPAGDLVPYLRDVQVLDQAGGAPKLRPPIRPVTVRHLLAHTSGMVYDWNDARLGTYLRGRDRLKQGTRAAWETPLIFDPGEEWMYGTGIDWVGQVVEAATGKRLDSYLSETVIDPLGMMDTTFTRSAAQRERTTDMRSRSVDGLTTIPFSTPENPEVIGGGSGLYSTVVDYLRFSRMLLNDGELDGVRILQPETVKAMGVNQLAPHLSAPGWRTGAPARSNDVALFPAQKTGWGLSFLLNSQTTPEGRSPGSLAWAGLANSYYWIDPTAGVTGVFTTQLLPFFDAAAVATFAAFERVIYER